MIDQEQLATLTTNLTLATKWVDPLNSAMDEFEINTSERAAMFLAQLAHESAGFAITEESLFYKSADRLRAVWPRRFGEMSDQEVAPYVRAPYQLASFIYADRMGNGDEASGDGWRFRGRGLIQLTGRTNYTAMSQALGVDLVNEPDLAAMPAEAARIAGRYWWTQDCNALADVGDFEGITKRINGGLVGQADRVAKLEIIRAAMA